MPRTQEASAVTSLSLIGIGSESGRPAAQWPRRAMRVDVLGCRDCGPAEIGVRVEKCSTVYLR